MAKFWLPISVLYQTDQGVWKRFSASAQSMKPKIFFSFIHSFQNFGFCAARAIFRRPESWDWYISSLTFIHHSTNGGPCNILITPEGLTCYLKLKLFHILSCPNEIPQPSITEIIWKMKYLKFHSNFPGTSELTKIGCNRNVPSFGSYLLFFFPMSRVLSQWNIFSFFVIIHETHRSPLLTCCTSWARAQCRLSDKNFLFSKHNSEIIWFSGPFWHFCYPECI